MRHRLTVDRQERLGRGLPPESGRVRHGLRAELREARKVMAAMRAGQGGHPGRVRNFETTFLAKGGPIALLRDGDRIVIDASRRVIETDADIESRRGEWRGRYQAQRLRKA